MMNRRDFLKKVFVGATALSYSAVYASVKPKTSRPNVLFIAIDDMNDWTTLFDKNNPIKTPNLERLAKRGVFFTKAFCSAALCNPSRTAIMTGLHATTSGVYSNGDPWREMLPDAVTLSQYFARHGYTTRGAGKIFHHMASGRSDPKNPDFQTFFPKVKTRAPKTNYNGYTPKDDSHLYSTSYDWGEHTQKMIDIDMVEWIENQIDEEWKRPMFLAAGIFKPHLPFYAPPEVFKHYPFDETKLPPMPEHDLDDVPPAAVKKAHSEFFIYENTTRQPVNSPGSRCDRPVSLLDLYPTLVELAGLPAKADNDGRNLVPLLKNPKKKWFPVIMTMGRGNHAVRSDRWRYIRYSDGSEELYDHSNDPWEWTNLARKPEYKEIIEQHRKWLPTEKR